MSGILNSVGDALGFAFGMTWQVLWALILGFALSSAVQALVSKEQMRRLLGDDSPRTLAVATALGAASSSCSYAAVALARSLFRRGANFVSAMAFQFGSTNLVVELGIILAVLIGWQFTVAEFIGGPIMVALMAIVFRRFLTPQLTAEARTQAERGLLGRMEGHAEMDMSVAAAGSSIWRRLRSPRGFTAVSNFFVMDWAAVWLDIAGGLLIAGALAAWVPSSFWRGLFLEHHGALATVWGPVIGPAVAALSFVCSIGNVPLAAVLWNGGISFGGVVSFIFADLIILPILNIYRKYYGRRVAVFLFATFYLTMTAAGLIVDLLFKLLSLEPTGARHAKVTNAGVSWDYTTVLNVVFLALAAVLVTRYFRRGGGLAMLREMNTPLAAAGHGHHATAVAQPHH
ncbi:MAG TPA: permease [Solirubrobacteraceae bacterium]|nr:permease [Solirubrobacteraceae bacterium]